MQLGLALRQAVEQNKDQYVIPTSLGMKGTGDTKPIMGHWDERIYLATANGELWEGRWGSDEPDPESPNWKPNAPLSFHKTELVIKVIDLVNPAIQSPPAPVARNYRTPQAQALASALQQGDLGAALTVLQPLSLPEARDTLLYAGFSMGTVKTKKDLLAWAQRELLAAAKSRQDGYDLYAAAHKAFPARARMLFFKAAA